MEEVKVERPDTILFSIPDFYNKFHLQEILLDIMDKEPGLFYPDAKIDSIYGTFPGAIWNGGRGSIGGTTYKNIYETIKFFNERKISVRFTFTNSQIEEKHLGDTYCNTILEVASKCAQEFKISNGVNVNRDILRDHVRKEFPDLYIVYSTTKGIDKDHLDLFNAMCEDAITVANYNWNKDILNMDIKHPENVELLVSEACIENCPNRMAHYADIGKQQLCQQCNGYTCPFGAENYYYYDRVPRMGHYISPEMTRTILPFNGFYQFKIPGRNDNNINTVENYVNYLGSAEPEIRDNLRNKILLSLVGF